MKLYIKLFFTFAILVTLSSCKAIKLDGNIDKMLSYDSIAVVQFVVSPPYQPTFPLIDAAIYNSDVEDIVPDILEINKDKANELADYTFEFFRDSTTLNLLVGEVYYNSEEYSNLKSSIKSYSLELDDDDLFEFAIPKNSQNYFDMFESFPGGYFDDIATDETPNKTIKKIAEILDREIVAVIATVNIPNSPGFFSSKWGTSNSVGLYFFSRDGKKLATVGTSSPNFPVSGDDPEGYGKLLNLYKQSISKIAKELNILKK